MSKRKSKKSKNTTLIVFLVITIVLVIALLLYFLLQKRDNFNFSDLFARGAKDTASSATKISLTKKKKCHSYYTVPRKKLFDRGANPQHAFGWSQLNNKLKECEGDCDSDDHCEGNLKCFQRSGYTGVPGCSGRGKSGHDYCYMPEPPLKTRHHHDPQGQPGFENNKLRECEGDCDSDDHCEGNLKCFQRTGVQKVPECKKGGKGGYDYCYDDNRLGNLSLTEKQCKTMAGPLYGSSDRWDKEPTGCIYQPKNNKYYYNKNENSRVECSGKSQCVKGVDVCSTDVTNEDVKKVLEQTKTSSNSSSDLSSKNSFGCTQCKSLLSVLEPTIVILYKWYVEKVNGKALGKALKSFVAEYPATVLSKGYSTRFIEDFKQSDFWTGFKENFMKDEDNEQKKAMETMGIKINSVRTQIKKKVLELLLECVKKSGKAFFDLVRDKNVPKFAHRFCRCLIIEFVRQALMYVTECTAEGACEPKMELFYLVEDEMDVIIAGAEDYLLPHVPQYRLVKGLVDLNNERRANMTEQEKHTEDQVRDGGLNIVTMGNYGIVKGGLGLAGITW